MSGKNEPGVAGTAPATDAQIAEWKGLTEKATPGPWTVGNTGFGKDYGILGDDDLEIADAYSRDNGSQSSPHSPKAAVAKANAAFIAAARIAVPALIDRLEQRGMESDKASALWAAADAFVTSSSGTAPAPVPGVGDAVSKVAHILTGLVAATCCHTTGGYGRKDDRHCECRDVAADVVAALAARPALPVTREAATPQAVFAAQDALYVGQGYAAMAVPYDRMERALNAAIAHPSMQTEAKAMREAPALPVTATGKAVEAARQMLVAHFHRPIGEPLAARVVNAALKVMGRSSPPQPDAKPALPDAVAMAKKALRPFAERADGFIAALANFDIDASDDLRVVLNLGDLRRAREALAVLDAMEGKG